VQAVTAYVEQISDEELNLSQESMDPIGMMTMSTNMVELLEGKRNTAHVDRLKEKEKVGGIDAWVV